MAFRVHVLDICVVFSASSTGTPYLRCTDGTTYRLPSALQEWATTVMGANHALKAAGNPSLFPGQVEFGVLHGGVYAELL
ncbi:hypothetical protein ACQPW1_10605 [Nocardia sp. CA-128927]|uniref:hypothetical protein n=1 Tax=Nocardia sp. CA-128927 TaxID=3239975 RepID=UPI003D9A00F1